VNRNCHRNTILQLSSQYPIPTTSPPLETQTLVHLANTLKHAVNRQTAEISTSGIASTTSCCTAVPDSAAQSAISQQQLGYFKLLCVVQKPHGYHLDVFVLALLIMVCSILGLPWFVAATVRSVTHVRSLLQESEVKIPGEKTQIVGAR